MDFRFKYRRTPPSPAEAAREEREEVETERRAEGLGIGLSIPFTLAGGPITGWLLGAWLDSALHTGYWMLVLILIGTAASLTMTVNLLSRLNRD